MRSRTAPFVLLFSCASLPPFAQSARTDAVLDVRVWRVEFPSPIQTDLDWEQAFGELERQQQGQPSDLARGLPSAGRPLVGADISVTRRPRERKAPVAPYHRPASGAGRSRLGAYSVQHRDAAAVDRLLKQVTGQVSDIPTRGSAVSGTESFREPVRTVADPVSGRVLVTAIDTAPQRQPLPPVPETELEFSAEEIAVQAPISARLTPIGRIPFAAFGEILGEQAKVERLSMHEVQCWEGVTSKIPLPFVHSRGPKGEFTVGLELHVSPKQLGEGPWLIDAQPHVLSFEQSPRTIRVVLQQEVTLQPGETLVLTHLLDPECARAPSMFDKKPPLSRTLIFITRPAR